MPLPALLPLLVRIVGSIGLRAGAAGVAEAAGGTAARVAAGRAISSETLSAVASNAIKPPPLPAASPIPMAGIKAPPIQAPPITKVIAPPLPTGQQAMAPGSSPAPHAAAPATNAAETKPTFLSNAKASLGRAFSNVGRMTGIGQSQPQVNSAPTGPRPDFSALASQPKNFSRLLSGQASGGQIDQESHQEDVKRKEEEAADAAKEFGKTLVKASALSIGASLAVLPAGKKFATLMVDANAHFARFNGQVAHAYAVLKRGDILRERASATATAGSTAGLVHAVNQMNDEIRPLKDIATNILNVVGIKLAQIVTTTIAAVKWIPGIAQAVDAIEKDANDLAAAKKRERSAPWMALLSDLNTAKGKPRRMPPQDKKKKK